MQLRNIVMCLSSSGKLTGDAVIWQILRSDGHKMDKDYMLNPEVKYNLTDSIWIALGGNVFYGGKIWSQFGQFAKDDNVYCQVRYEF